MLSLLFLTWQLCFVSAGKKDNKSVSGLLKAVIERVHRSTHSAGNRLPRMEVCQVGYITEITAAQYTWFCKLKSAS
jgi:hypothetical protein